MQSFKRSIAAAIALAMLLLLPAVASLAAGECGMCAKPITGASNVFEITDERGWSQRFGCPGCGLSTLSTLGVDSRHSISVQDFLSRRMVNALEASYVRGASVGYCCQPSWLAFEKAEDARKFARGFGGEVLDFDAALEQAARDHGAGHSH